MDFFDTGKDGFSAMRTLAETDLSAVSLNYSTLNKYSNSIMQKEYHKALFTTRIKPSQMPIAPIRPMAVTPRRLFSEDPNEKRSEGRFFDFLKNIGPSKEVENKQEQKGPEVAQQAKPEETVAGGKTEQVETPEVEPFVAEQVA